MGVLSAKPRFVAARACGIALLVVSFSLLLGAGGDDAQRYDPASHRMELVAVKNGFGQLLPHRVALLDDQGSTSEIIDVTRPERPRQRHVLEPDPAVHRLPPVAVLPSNESGHVRRYQVVPSPRM